MEILTPTAQQRIFYIGSVYHVFADIRMLSAVFGLTIFPISLGGVLVGNLPIPDATLGFFIATFLIILWLYLHPEFFNKGRKSKGDQYEAYIMKMQRRFIDLEIGEIREKICLRKSTTKEVIPKNEEDN